MRTSVPCYRHRVDGYTALVIHSRLSVIEYVDVAKCQIRNGFRVIRVAMRSQVDLVCYIRPKRRVTRHDNLWNFRANDFGGCRWLYNRHWSV